MAVIDHFVLDHAPGPLAELHPSLVRARGEVESLLGVMATAVDESLRFAWDWEGNDADVRYAFYRALETLESAAARAQLALAGAPSSEAREAVAAASVARWDLQGVLATVADGDLDADPGDGEWTVRQTVAHINGGQRGYAWGTAWWLSTRDQPREPGRLRPPEEVFAGLPDEAEEATGSVADVRRQVHDVVDGTSSRYATLTDDDLDVTAGWSGILLSVRFRQWRWSSHIQEHTVQVEKTLDMLGRRPTEVQRLARLVARAFGRLESVVYYRPAAEVDGVAAILDAVAVDLGSIRESLRAALDARRPAGEDW